MWVMGRDAGRKNMGIVQTILWKERLHELKKLIEREWMVQTEMKKLMYRWNKQIQKASV